MQIYKIKKMNYLNFYELFQVFNKIMFKIMKIQLYLYIVKQVLVEVEHFVVYYLYMNFLNIIFKNLEILVMKKKISKKKK